MGKRIFLMSAVAILAWQAGGDAAYAAKRSCDAELRLDLKPRGSHPTGVALLDAYSASGVANTANKARRNARANARQCGGKVWEDRWNNLPNPPGIPSQCTSSNRVKNFNTTNIKCKIFDAICHIKWQQGRGFNSQDYARIWLKTTGQTSSCGSTHLYSGNYGLSECSFTRRAEVCGNLPLQFGGQFPPYGN